MNTYEKQGGGGWGIYRVTFCFGMRCKALVSSLAAWTMLLLSHLAGLRNC